MKKLFGKLLCVFFALCGLQANAQTSLPVVKPLKVDTIDFSAKKNYEAPNIDFYLEDPDDETGGAGDAGYEWYEYDRDLITVTASSSLPKQGRYTYQPSCLIDGRVDLPWCEGVKGNGVGQTITFKFSDMSRLSLIRIVNGFAYNKGTYANNARAKKIQLALNDKPIAVLELQDIIGYQYFSLTEVDLPINWDDKSFSYTFTILDVYPGAKYQDLLISEVNFATQARCFVKGTMVSMADGSLKPIEQIKKGDNIYYFDGQSLASASVEEIAKVKHSRFVVYSLENGNTVTCTPDHPVMCVNKGWVSANASKTASSYKGYAGCKQISVGDIIVTTSGNSKIVDIKEISGEQDSYTIVKAGSATNFIANGLQVGVEQKK